MINNTMELRLTAQSTYAKVAVESVLAYIRCFKISFNEENISTVVEEAFNNAAEHAYPHDSDGKVTIRARIIYPDFLSIQILDEGVGIEDVAKVREPFYTRYIESDFSEHSGMGMTIMEQFSDRFDIWSKPNLGTDIIFTFKGIEE